MKGPAAGALRDGGVPAVVSLSRGSGRRLASSCPPRAGSQLPALPVSPLPLWTAEGSRDGELVLPVAPRHTW